MMTATDIEKSKLTINQLLDKYDAQKVGQVAPGTEIPGGLYFNVFVPIKNMKNMLTEVSDLEESTIFESKTRSLAPRGKTRVFIWLKSI